MTGKRQQAVAFFVSKGWTLAQSAGIVANLEAESGLRPDAIGDGGQAYGIAQWHPPRQANFATWFGKDIKGSSFEEQIEFVHLELTRTEMGAGAKLRACSIAADAGAVVSMYYERPADRDGEARKRAALATRIFAGGQPQPAIPGPVNHSNSANSSINAPTPQERTEKRMPILALLSAFGPLIAQLIPQIATIMQPKGEVAQRNIKLAEVAFDTITKAAGAVNVQEAVTKMQADPALTAEVAKAVVQQPEIWMVVEIGEGGIAAAKEASIVMQNAEKPFWFNPAFAISCLLSIYPTMLCVDVFYVHPDAYDGNLRTQIVTGILAVIMILGAFWLGSSIGSQKKTDNAAAGHPVA